MKRIKIYVLVMLITLSTEGQDYHLSQYFSTPLLLNPSLTANIDGPYRVTANFRKQWWQNGFPYNTYTVGFENRVLKNRLQEYSRLGYGIAFMGDESLGGVYKNTTSLLSVAYHQPLDIEGIHSVGGGIQFSYGTRRIDFNRLYFESQFSPEGFNTSIPSGEVFQTQVKTILDLNAGLVYTYNDGINSFYLGGSVYNIRRPQYSYFSDSLSRIPMRKMLHGGANLEVSPESNNKITVSFLAMQQAKVVELNLGLSYGLKVGNNYMYLGAFSRFRDAIYPYVSFQTQSMQFGLSYDVLTSDLKMSNPRKASMELTFLFVRPDNSDRRRFMPWNY